MMESYFGISCIIISVLIAIVNGMAFHHDDTDAEVREYCQLESFNVTCGKSEVILMTSAMYGRMQLGRCAQDNYGLGCSTDVLHYMDSYCSGRRHCFMPIPQLDEVSKPCSTDMKTYLEASYHCVPVIHDNCEPYNSHVIDVEPTTGYLSVETSDHRYTGRTGCPWQLQAPEGQKIQIELFSFLPILTHGSSGEVDGTIPIDRAHPRGYDHNCPVFVSVQEVDDNPIDIKLCTQISRQGTLYTSTGSEITLSFTPTTNDVDVRYLLKYSPVGCVDLAPQPESTLRRDGDNLMIKCNRNKETWYMTCKGNQWVGEMGNCTQGHMRQSAGIFTNGSSVPHSLIMAVIVGILLGILVGTVLLAIVFTCKRKHQLLLHKKKDSRAYILAGNHQVTSRQSSARSSLKSAPYGSKSYLKHSSKSLDKGTSGDAAFAQQVRPLINNNGQTDSVDSRSTPTTVDYQMSRSIEDFSGASTPQYVFPTTTLPPTVTEGRTIPDYPQTHIDHDTGRHMPERSQSRIEQPVGLPVYFELDPNDAAQHYIEQARPSHARSGHNMEVVPMEYVA